MTRISLGFVLAGLAMFWAAAVQYAIYISPPNFHHPLFGADGSPQTGTPNHVSIYWQLGPYVLIAISESNDF